MYRIVNALWLLPNARIIGNYLQLFSAYEFFFLCLIYHKHENHVITWAKLIGVDSNGPFIVGASRHVIARRGVS